MANKTKYTTIAVQDAEIRIKLVGNETFFSLTDLAKTKNPDKPDQLIGNFMRNYNTIELMRIWEITNQTTNFDVDAALAFRAQSGANAFSMSVKQWCEATNAVGIHAKAGRYGGTYAHEDITIAFCSWISPAFQLHFIKEYKRLKLEEAERLGISWDRDAKRFFARVNHHVHTDAVKNYLIPERIIRSKQEWLVYASEADLLNKALFGITAKEWRLKNPETKGNIRDQATAEQLLVLANLENLNAEYIHLGLSKDERIQRLNEVAIHQLELLLKIPAIKRALDPPRL